MKTTAQENGDTTWHFSKAELAALVAHASTDETRPGLNGVMLDSSMRRADATDGHRLVFCYAGSAGDLKPSAVEKKSLIPRDVMAKAVKLAGKKDEIRITPNCTTVRVAVTSVDKYGAEAEGPAFDAKLTEASHPPVDQVMPSYDGFENKHKGVRAGINTGYLADLNLVARAANERTESVTLYPPSEELSPFKAECRAPDGTSWVVAIMPMRI